jgi:hypothetical protein
MCSPIAPVILTGQTGYSELDEIALFFSPESIQHVHFPRHGALPETLGFTHFPYRLSLHVLLTEPDFQPWEYGVHQCGQLRLEIRSAGCVHRQRECSTFPHRSPAMRRALPELSPS